MTEQSEPKPARRSASRPVRVAAIAALAGASLVSGNASANAGANMNLGYEFLDEIRRAEAVEPESAQTDHAASVSASESVAPNPAASESALFDSALPDSSVSGRAPAAVPEISADRRIELEKRLAEAERLYRGGDFNEAMPVFRSIVDIDAAHAHAWLRIGNLLHRKRDWFNALTAYRRAARPQADLAIREKAVYNVGVLNLELARQALKRLERIRADDDAGRGMGDAQREPGVSDRAVKQLSDQLGRSYDALSAARSRTGYGEASKSAGSTDINHMHGATGPEGASDQAVRLSLIRAAPSSATPSPGPRTPKPAPAEKPVEVEIRQGGGAR